MFLQSPNKSIYGFERSTFHRKVDEMVKISPEGAFSPEATSSFVVGALFSIWREESENNLECQGNVFLMDLI